ncbi:MAG: NAD(P)/FAD-dependent oxidoreductase, partial [Oscillospiraceae bacterium]
YDSIVVGGGAAGLIAAITGAKQGKKILILERNDRLGKKLLITGKGRCNVTNACDLDEFMSNIPSNGRFLFSAFSGFTSADVMEFFTELGVPLKIERGKRVFPVSDRANDVVSALEKAVKAYDITVKTARVKSLIIENSEIKGVSCEQADFFAESVLVATGGKSYPLTGSTGDGYAFAEQAGHKIIPLVPSLVPIVTEEKFCADMMGLSLKNATLTLRDKEKNKVLYSELGEMLFTHFGVSGPLVLSAASHIREMKRNRYSLEIDLKPALSVEKLDARVVRDFTENANKDFANSLRKLLPAKIIPVIVSLSGISGDTKINQITKEQRLVFVNLLKKFPLSVKEFRPIDEAIITSGGVSIKEINPKTMESKLVKGLYFAGEVIDVDGYTGGFNLQIAFSTGYAAGINM